MTVRFRVLGPVRAFAGPAELPLGTPQQRGLLGLLLLRDAPVPVDDVVDALWGPAPPRTARGTVRTYAARLRQVLGDGAPLRHSAAGYRLDRGRAELDAADFTALVGRARGERPDAAAATLRRALDLWAGPALADAHGAFVAGQRVRLDGLWRAARERWFEAELACDRHDAIRADLGAAVAEHPLDARLTELWMTTLHRTGRTAEALAVYRDFRERHREELGLEPGAALTALHGRILRGEDGALPETPAGRDRAPVPRARDPRDDGGGPERAGRAVPVVSDSLRRPPVVASADSRRPMPAAVDRPPIAGPAGPDQLPPGVPDFTGRADEIAWLHGVLAGAAPVAGITGLGGSGKTTLAVHAVRLLGQRWAHGRLFVDLAARTGTPATPHEVLGRLLRAAGVERALPESLDERSALWRTTIAGRRLVLVLDDADGGDQVAPLLPGTPGCAVVITSTRRLLDLPAARWRRLGALEPAEAVRLLGEIAGHRRVAGEPETAARLVAACSWQPLSVRVAAARLLDRPHWSVAQIMAQLDDDLRQPVVMHEDCRIVDEPIRRAERGLHPATASVFRLAALPETADRRVDGVASSLALPPARARAALEDLVDAHLIEAVGTDTYRYPVLVQAYARRRAAAVDGARRCAEVLGRFVPA